MTLTDLIVIGPLLAAIATAVAILLVDLVLAEPLDAGRPGRPHRPRGHRRRDRRRGAGRDRDPVTAFGGAYRLDALTTFLDLLFISIVAMTIMFAPDYLAPRGLPVAEFATILVFAMCGAMVIAASADLVLLFIGLELMVLPGYLLAGYHKHGRLLHRGRDQVLPPGLVQLSDLPVRPGVRVGPERVDPDHGRGEHAQPGCQRPGTVQPGPRDGFRLPHDRGRIQDCRGPVPLLDAGRLPGLADPGHRLPVGRAQDRRLRADPAPVRGGARAPQGAVAAGRHHPRRHDDDPRQPGGPDPDERQADARLQLDRPHRLHARGPGSVRRRPAPGPRGAALLWRCLLVHEPRRICGDRGAPEAGRRDVRPEHVRRARPAASRSSGS